MKTVNLLDNVENLDKFSKACFLSFPKGGIYNVVNGEKGENNYTYFFQLFRGLLASKFSIFATLNEVINQCYEITVDNLYLDEYKNKYGLPNPIFQPSDLQTKESIVFAINAMKFANQLLDIKSFRSFFAFLNINVKFYKHTDMFPTTVPKEKLLYYVYVADDNDTTEFYNLGSAFPLQFGVIGDKTNKVKQTLEYLAPVDAIFSIIGSPYPTQYEL